MFTVNTCWILGCESHAFDQIFAYMTSTDQKTQVFTMLFRCQRKNRAKYHNFEGFSGPFSFSSIKLPAPKAGQPETLVFWGFATVGDSANSRVSCPFLRFFRPMIQLHSRLKLAQDAKIDPEHTFLCHGYHHKTPIQKLGGNQKMVKIAFKAHDVQATSYQWKNM